MSSSLLLPNMQLVAPASSDMASQIAAALGALHAKVDALSVKFGTLTRRAPYLEMPSDGIPFNELGWVVIPAIGSTATIITFVVPGGMNGSIKWIGNSIIAPGFYDGSGAMIWQILADGQPLRNFENMLGSLGSPTSPSETAPIRIFEQQTITLIAQNVSVPPAGGFLGGRLSGWHYPMEYDAPPAAADQEAAQDEQEEFE